MAKITGENISPEHVKAARALLRWTASDLADQCSIGVATIRLFESGKVVREASRNAIYEALTEAGAVMGNGGKPSVSLSHTKARKD